jgi:hypothetical protein
VQGHPMNLPVCGPIICLNGRSAHPNQR